MEDNAFYYYYSGLASLELQQPKEASYFFQQCVKSDPEDADAFYQLGLVLKQAGNESLAGKALQKAAALRVVHGQRPSKEEKIIPRIF